MNSRDPKGGPGGAPTEGDGSALGKMELRKVRAGPAPGTYDFDSLEATPSVEEEFLREDTLRGNVGGGASGALVAAAELAFLTLEKALKMKTFYEGRGENYERVKKESERAFLSLVEQHGEVELEVTPFQLLADGEPVYSSEEDRSGLSYALFRDGLRRISLLPGFTVEEVSGLLDIFSATTSRGSDDNTVTLLWDMDMPHLRYRAADMFTEGVMSASVGQLGQSDTRKKLDQLVADLETSPVKPGHDDRVKRPNADALGVVMAQRERRIKDLNKVAEVARAKELAGQRLGDRKDTWRRAVTLMARLGSAEEDREKLAGVLANMLEELLRTGRGEILRTACLSMAPHLGFPARLKDPDAPLPPTGALFQMAMDQLCEPEKLGPLEAMLQEGEATLVEQAAALVMLLPAKANPILVPLTAAMPPCPPRDKLVNMLERRGADLSELHAIRLSAGTQDEALEAVKRLAPLSKSRGSRNALIKAARHPSTRVRLAAVRALGDEVDDAMAQVLLENISSGLVELQQLSFKLLESMPRSNQGPVLLSIVRGDAAAEWNPRVLKRAMELMVRWGGSGVDVYIVDGLCVGNLFRRRAVEERREELMSMVRAVGGSRGLEICRKALDASPPKAIRSRLMELKDQLTRQVAADKKRLSS